MRHFRAWEILLLLFGVSLIQYLAATFRPEVLYLDISLVVAMYVGWRSDPARAAVCGTIFGLSQDMVLLAPYLGLNGMTKTLAAFAASYMSRYVLLEGNRARFVAMALFSALDRVFIALLLWLLSSRQVVWSLPDLLLAGALTGLAGAFFFHYYDKIKIPRKDFRKIQNGDITDA